MVRDARAAGRSALHRRARGPRWNFLRARGTFQFIFRNSDLRSTAPVANFVFSNRVARVTPGGPMMGGLASALLPAVRMSGVVWFGSSGKLRDTADGTPPLVQLETYGRGTIATVDLPAQHYSGFYEGFANSALWPLLHARHVGVDF